MQLLPPYDNELDGLLTEITDDAMARHRDRAVDYWNALREISALGGEHDLPVAKRIAERALRSNQ